MREGIRMPEEYKLPTDLETMSVDYWFPKFVMSFLLFFAAPLFLDRERPLSVVVVAIFVTGGFFFLSLTRVKPEADVIKYRRFFQWQPIPYSEISGCSTFWILGFISTRRYIFPLGVIVFVLPRDRENDYRWDKEIVLFLRNKAHPTSHADQ